MSYLVLARRWRPQIFEEVIGQIHITKTLKSAISANRVGHAFLFSGPRGVGKTSVARILAKALNCEKGPTAIPCNICTSCREISEGISPDVLEIDGASHTGVDDIRGIRENISYLPAKSKYKIYVIDEVHMLSTSAFNALLKTMEEPPEHVIFIFATTEPHKIPMTVLSRCQRFDFKRIPLKDILIHLKNIISEEGVGISERSLLLIAKEAQGSMRDAQSFLDQVISFGGKEIDDTEVIEVLGLIDRKLLYETSQAIIERNSRQCLELIETVYNFGYNMEQFYQELVESFRNLIVVKICQQFSPLINLPEDEIIELREQAGKISLEDLQQLFTILLLSESELKRATSPKLILEMTLLKMTQVDSLITLDEILTKIVRLEERLSDRQKDISFDAIPKEEAGTLFNDTLDKKRGPSDRETPLKEESGSANSDKKVPLPDMPEETWKNLISYLKKNELLQTPFLSLLKEGKLLNIGSDEIELGFKNSFLLEKIKEKMKENHLSKVIRSFFKREVTIKVSTLPSDSTLADTAFGKQDENHKDKTDLLRKEASENPIIRYALNIFGGEISEIKTDIGSD
jgi:DNA polymerase-3 subunit gamma/tau